MDGGLGDICGLAEDLIADRHDGIGSENPCSGAELGYGSGLASGVFHDESGGAVVVENEFLGFGGNHVESLHQVHQQLASSG